MATQRQVNVFSGGMVADVDPHQQQPNTYRRAKNLRLLYNTDPAGSATEGRSLSLEIMAGTQKAWALPTGYTQIGEIDTTLGLCIFSHNGTNSEIGYVDYDSDGVALVPAGGNRPVGYRYVYYTLYNDRYDPNNEKLDFPVSDHFQVKTETENALITRIYWVDGTHGLRVLNLKLAWHVSGNRYHQDIVGGIIAKYPRHLSVHQMEVLPDVAFNDLDYHERIPGSLLSGGYQVTYRYRTADGHASPWAPLNTRPYFVSDKPVPVNTVYTNVTQFSHHTRYMGASGVPTSDGMRLYLRGVDTRWNSLELAVLYHRGAVGVERALLTKRIDLVTANFDPDFMEINITDFSGTSLNVQDFLSQQQGFDTIQTLAAANNRLYLGGVKLAKALAVDASKVTNTFCEQLFFPDETLTPTFKEKINGENAARKDGDKLTDSVPVHTFRSYNLFNDKSGNPVAKGLPIFYDYNHTKGVQIDSRFGSYRRGETYPFAALCIDTKGIPYFAVPLKDVTFPAWADKPPAKKVGQFYQTSHLGVRFDGIRLPKEMVYDTNGKRRLGSILILRGQPSGRIGFQAVALNCTTNVVYPSSRDTSDDGYENVGPHNSWNNAFVLENSGLGGMPSHLAPHAAKTSEIPDGGGIVIIKFGDNTNLPNGTINKAYWVTLHAPDVLTTGVLPNLAADPSARLQMVGAAHGAYGNEIRMQIAEGVDFPGSRGGPLHIYSKNYKTNGQLLSGGDANGRPALGAKTRIKTWFRHDNSDRTKAYHAVDPDKQKLIFSPFQTLFPQYRERAFSGTNQPEYRIRWGDGGNPKPGQHHWEWNHVDAMLAPGSVVACLKDWEAVDVIESKDSYVSLGIVNFVKGADPQPAADERTYIPTGYQLNFTDAILDQLPVDVDNAGKTTAFVLNGVEVYGGDTYVNMIDFCRLYPLWDEGCERRNTYTPDYGVGHIVPMESKYNFALRQGRSLANNGMYSQEAACENRFLHATNGIAWGQPEEWNINDVLTPKEAIAVYKPLPATIKITDDRPYSNYVSQPKQYGERDDSYRQWRPLDYYDQEGTNGPIMRMETLLGGIYVWQQRDYGRLRARDQAILPSSVGELTTGTGKDLAAIDYAGQGIGLHEFDALTSGSGRIYWLDTQRKLLCRMSQAGKDELSEREHQHDLFFTTLPDKSVSGIALGLDDRHGDVWISYGRQGTNQSRTVLYNEKLDVFIAETDCQPRRYVNFRGKLYGQSRVELNRIDRLSEGPSGVYFDKPYVAELDWVSNPSAMYPKVFDNLGLTLSVPQALVGIQLTTADDTQYIDLRPGKDRRVVYRRGCLWFPLMNLVPRNGSTDPRLVDKYLRLLLTIDARQTLATERFVLVGSEIFYRLAPRV